MCFWLDNQLRQSLPSAQLQKLETRRKRIRKSLENITPQHFLGFGTGSRSSFPPLPNSNKKKEKGEEEEKRGWFIAFQIAVVRITSIGSYIFLFFTIFILMSFL